MQGIRIGLGLMLGQQAVVEKLVAQMRQAEELGFATAWLPNIFGADAMTICALAGAVTSRIEIGTAVVPTFSRHPLYMAQQALTTQAATGGRFTLGLGPSHKIVIEDMLGLSYAKPARHVREYVTVLGELLEKRNTEFEGELYRVKGSIDIACDTKPQLLIGALGPLMRKIAGSLCDGTLTWMTGPRTLGEQVAPGVRAAAEAAGRPAPRVVAGIPICLTNDPDGARAKAANLFAIYGLLPSYKAMLELEGAIGPGDVAIVGDERAIEAAIRRFADAGATDLQAAIFPLGDDAGAEVRRTRAFLSELSRS